MTKHEDGATLNGVALSDLLASLHARRPRTEIEEKLQKQFEAAAKKHGINWVNFSGPYMEEHLVGYDSPWTIHMYAGFLLGLAAQANAQVNRPLPAANGGNDDH